MVLEGRFREWPSMGGLSTTESVCTNPAYLEGDPPVANRSIRRSKKILLSLAAVGSAASIAGLGTYATFTDSDSASQSLSTGTVIMDFGTGAGENTLTTAASGMVPGDTVQRRIKLNNSGTEQLSVALTTAATTSSVLDSDATDGLQLVVEKCSGAWYTTDVAAPYTYTCDDGSLATLLVRNDGTVTPVVSSRPIIGSALAIDDLTSGESADLRVTSTLPSTAGNGFQNKTSVIQYTFNSTQRAATSK